MNMGKIFRYRVTGSCDIVGNTAFHIDCLNVWDGEEIGYLSLAR